MRTCGCANSQHVVVLMPTDMCVFADSFGDEVLRYTYGWGDVYTVLFYFLICIIAHAVIQDYILDVG